MCITFVFFRVLVENKQSTFLCLVTKLFPSHAAAKFQMHKENRLTHIDFRLITKGLFEKRGKCLCLVGIESFELSDLAVEMTVAQKLAQRKLL